MNAATAFAVVGVAWAVVLVVLIIAIVVMSRGDL